MTSNRFVTWLLIGGGFFVLLAPTVPWMQFTGGMENFNVETALETVRHGNWLVPTLENKPRIEKPPLVQWLTSLGILSSESLGWGPRWPSLLAACLTLIAVSELGRTVEDHRLGVLAALVCGSSLFFLKFATEASYDIHLMLWVTAANVFILRAMFEDRGRWANCLGAGAALGLALMSKGPPALLETIVPVVIFIIWQRRDIASGKWMGPIALGTVACLLIAAPWPLYIWWRANHAMGTWYQEVSLRDEAKENRVGWYTYIVLLPLMIPWVVWFIAGLIDAVRTPRKQSPLSARIWMCVFWLIVPMCVLEFMPARRDRYALPMLAPASIMAAIGIVRFLPKWGNRNLLRRGLAGIHIGVIVAMAILFPIWGWISIDFPARIGHFSVPRLELPDGAAWYSAGVGLSAALAAVAITVAAFLWYRRSTAGLIAGTVALAMLFHITFVWGYSRAEGNVDQGPQTAQTILEKYPDAEVYNADPRHRRVLPENLLIYLNRDVPGADDPFQLAPSVHPQVLVYPPEDRGEIHPPPGFVHLADRKLNSQMYRMYVRLPDSAPR